MKTLRTTVGLACLLVIGLSLTSAQEPAPKIGPAPKAWQKTVDKALDYLKTSQAHDGTWSKDASPGVTSVVLLGLTRSGALAKDDPLLAKALKHVEALADKEAGHIAGSGKDAKQLNYLTSINLMALQAADAKAYDATIKKAAEFLKTMPYDEKRGKKPEDVFYGGCNYGTGETRPDMSNTTFCIEALRAGGVPATDPVFKKLVVFVSRSQNLKGEHNDQPWAGKINDGSFMYGAGPAGQKKDAPADTPRPGYGAMTCAGLTDLLACGVDKKDPRAQKAWDWVQKEYTVDTNPGMRPGLGNAGYYYYLAALARCLDRLGVDEVTDGKGVKHDWRREIWLALAARQQKDGRWVNETPAFMEGNPDLTTGWALIALGYCKPKTP